MIEADNIKKNKDEVQEYLLSFINNYNSPSFGSISKRDVDVSIFMLMQDLGIINVNPQIYDVVSLLHITSSKARNLIYEASLRRNNTEQLDDALFELLKSPIFLSTSDNMIAVEIDDPLLIDHLKQKLRELKFVTDGSFNKGIVKMTVNAYATLFDLFLSSDIREKLFPGLGQFSYDDEINLKEEDDVSSRSKKVLNWIFKKLINKVVDKDMEQILPKIHKKISEVLEMDNIGELISWIDEM